MAQQPTHRYNRVLPPLYRDRVSGEARLIRRALMKIAKSDWSTEEFDSDLDAAHESYELPSERALSVLERGVSRALELKYEFTGDEYSTFANTLLRAGLTPSLDPGLRSKAIRSAVRMLGKRECVIPGGIQWRSIVDAILRDHIESMHGAAFWGREIRDVHCRNLVHLLQYCMYHMPEGDDARIVWNSFIEKIRLIDDDPDIAFLSFLLMSYILPVRGQQWTGWTDEAIRLWRSVENCPIWDSQWISMFAKVAKHQPFVIDWDEVVPLMYKQLTASLHLPLGAIAPHTPSKRHPPRHCYFLIHSDLTSAVAVFTAYSLSPVKPVVRSYFEQIVVLLENYCHPSNSGRWSSTIAAFLGTFTSSFMHRVTHERSATKAGVTDRVISTTFKSAVCPMEHRLGDEYVEEIVKTLLPLLKLGINSKSHTMIRQACSSARDLSVLAPHLVLPPMLEFAQEGLLYVPSPHRTSAALKVLSTLSPSFLDLELYPEGAQTLTQTLELILPGIDINDPSKTDGALRVLGAAASQMRALLDSDAVPGLHTFLEDYIPQVLDRIFSLFSSLEAPPKKNRAGVFPQTTPQVSILLLYVAMDNLFASLPRPLVVDSAKRIARQISGSATMNAMKQYAVLVRTSAAALAFNCGPNDTNPAPEIFIPNLLGQVLDEDSENNFVFTSLSNDELVWRIRMLAQACRCVGPGMKVYMKKLCAVVRLSFARNERPVYKAGGRLLRGILEGLTATQVSNESPTERPVLNSEGKYDREVRWHSPSGDDWKVAIGIVHEFLELAEDMVYTKSDAKPRRVNVNRDVLFRALRLLHAIQRGARWILGGAKSSTFDGLEKFEQPEEVEMTVSQALRAVRRPVCAGLYGEVDPKCSSELWNKIYSVISDIIGVALKERPDDGIFLYRTLEPLELSSEPLKRAGSGRLHDSASQHYKSMYKSVLALRRPHGVDEGAGRSMPNFIFRLRVAGMHDSRLAYAARPGSRSMKLFKCITDQVSEFTLNEFPRVRAEARGIYTRALRVSPISNRRKAVSKFIEVLGDSAEAARKAQKEQFQKSLSPSKSKPADATDAGSSEDVVMKDEGGEAVVNGLKPNKTEIHYERMIGAAHVLRSSCLVPLMMRSVTFYDSVIRALIEAVLSAERPDSAIHTGSLFFRLMQSARPLTLSPTHFMKSDLISVDDSSSNGIASDALWTSRRERLDKLNTYLLSLVQKPLGNDVSADKLDVHWRRQSLVASLLFFNIREDCAPSFEVTKFFTDGLVSDVVSMRQISAKALAVILALHGKNDFNKFIPCTGLPQRHVTPMLVSSGEPLAAIEAVIGNTEYAKKMITTLALDHEAMDGDVRAQQSRTPGGYQSLLGLVSHSDGYSLWMIDSGDHWPKSMVPRSRDSIVLPRVRLYERLIRNFGFKAFSAFVEPVTEIVSKVAKQEKGIIDGVKDEDVRIVIAEVVIGICRGMAVELLDDKDRAIDGATDWAKKVLESLTGPQGVVNGATSIRLICTSEAGMLGISVGENLFEWVMSSKPIIAPVGSGVAARMQARQLRYIHSFFADLKRTDEQKIKRILEETSMELTQEGGFAHELKAVREEVARFLSLSVYYSDLYEPLDLCLNELVELMHGTREEGAKEGISEDIERMAITEEDKEDSPENQAKKKRSRLGETMSRLIQLVCYSSRSRNFHNHFIKLLPSHFESLDDQDKSRLSHARMALSLAAQCQFEQSNLSKVIGVAEKAAQNPSWKIRGAVIPFLQVILFTAQFTAGEELLTQMRNIVVGLISDPQIEVRAAAAAAFVPIIRDAPQKDIASTREFFMQVIKETQPLRMRAGKKREPMSSDVIRKRHGAALGLSSMVISSPYSVPAWMAGILVALSNCVNDPPPISTSVKTLFVDFMRTHRDEWQVHKQAFTEEELEIVLDLLVSPSYYA